MVLEFRSELHSSNGRSSQGQSKHSVSGGACSAAAATAATKVVRASRRSASLGRFREGRSWSSMDL